MSEDAYLLLLLAEATQMLRSCVVSGGRFDYMCSQCGGDDGDLGGDPNVTHKPGCPYVKLKAQVDAVMQCPQEAR